MTLLIECPICYWRPDGEPYWRCSCGYKWNTFETKGRCPKCNVQWDKTYCPGCEKTTEHSKWYVDSKTKENETISLEMAELKDRKFKLESRLINLGIKNYRVSYLPYLDYSAEAFQTPFEVGCRLIILYAVAYSVHHLNDRPKLIDWFKRENLWDRVSPEEKEYLTKKKVEEREIMNLSWRIEGALTLGWAMGLFEILHNIDTEETPEEMEIFESKIPELFGETREFLSNLGFRKLEEIYEENLLNELATTYFRDLLFNGKNDETKINRMVSFERHKSLNWVRRFSGMSEWDKTDTST